MNNLWWIPIIIMGVLFILLLVAVLGILISYIYDHLDKDHKDDTPFIDDFPQF